LLTTTRQLDATDFDAVQGVGIAQRQFPLVFEVDDARVYVCDEPDPAWKSGPRAYEVEYRSLRLLHAVLSAIPDSSGFVVDDDHGKTWALPDFVAHLSASGFDPAVTWR
jgi:hypothetical protein